MHYLLFYDYAGDYLDRRGQFRAEHLKLAREAVARGELVLGGALANPPDGGVLVFRGSSPAVAEAFASADPLRHARAGDELAGPRMDDGGGPGGGGSPAGRAGVVGKDSASLEARQEARALRAKVVKRPSQ